MDLILLALIIAGIVWAWRNRGRLGMLRKPARHVETTLVSGVVTGLSRHTETRVSGSGTGTSMSVSSTSVLHQQLFVRQDDGVEVPLHTWGIKVPLADGQRVTVIYSEANGESDPVYVVNHNARQGWPLFSRPQDLAVRLGLAPATPMIVLRAIGAGILVVFASLLLSVVSDWFKVIAVLGFPIAFLYMLFRDAGRRRRMGAELLAEYKAREQEVLATSPRPTDAAVMAASTNCAHVGGSA